MTPEEAAEVILGCTNPFIHCPSGCDGGWYYEDGYTGPKVQCEMCDGYAVVIEPRYEEACRLLGKDLPRRSMYLGPVSKMLEMNSMKNPEKLQEGDAVFIIEIVK